MNVDTACLARTYKSLEHPREWNRWFSRGRGRGKKRGVGSALTFLRWHPWNAACGTFERCSLLHSCYIHFAPRIRHFSNRRSRRCFLASRFHSEWIQFPYFVPLCRIRELFSGERERSINFVRVFATLEIYFRIILLIRKNFPQEEEKNNSAFEDFDGFLFNPLNLKNLSSIIKLNFGKFIHVRGNLLEDYFHNPISFLWNVIPASWFWKISNRITKLDSSWRISENIWWNDMYKREYGSTLSVLMHYFQIREIGTFFFFFFFHSDRIVYGTRNFEERKWKNAATALTSLMSLKRRWKCVFCSYIGNWRDANKKEVENKKKSIDNEIKGKIEKRGIKDPGTKIYRIIQIWYYSRYIRI